MKDAALADISSVTDVSQVHALMASLTARQAEVDAELDRALADETVVRARLGDLSRLDPRLAGLAKDASDLEERIGTTNTIAERICGQVRVLDTLQSRVRSVFDRVGDIVDLKQCIDGVKMAMQDEDFEEAARHIERFLSFDAAVLEGEVSTEVLRAAEGRLRQIIVERAARAAEEKNTDDVARFAFLYKPLGMALDGLRLFSAHVASAVTDLGKDQLRTMDQSGDEDDDLLFVEPLEHVFEAVAAAVEDHGGQVDAAFEAGAALFLILTLQESCDAAAKALLARFARARRIPKLVTASVARLNRRPAAGAGAGGDFGAPSESVRHGRVDLSGGVGRASNAAAADAAKAQAAVDAAEAAADAAAGADVRDLDPLLDEIAVISNRSETYDAFIRARAASAFHRLAVDSPIRADVDRRAQFRDGFPACTGLSEHVQGLIGDYITLEHRFMVDCIRKAVRMEQLLEADAQVTSMVDDVFFVLIKCGRRAINTLNASVVGAVLNNICMVLTTTVRARLEQAIASKAGTQQNALARPFLVSINNIEMSREYIKKLKASLEADIADAFGAGDAADAASAAVLAKLEHSLSELNDAGDAFKGLLQTALGHLCTAVVHKIHPLIEVFLSANYTPTGDEFSAYEINDPWVRHFITAVDAVLQPCRDGLTTSNHDALIHLVVQYIAKRLEKLVMAQKFNLLGGLQFDKDVRAMVSHFSDVTQRTVRDKFARLSQMASILNLEQVSEMLDYWASNSGTMVWRLTGNEVRRILALRTDFSKDAIARLKL